MTHKLYMINLEINSQDDSYVDVEVKDGVILKKDEWDTATLTVDKNYINDLVNKKFEAMMAKLELAESRLGDGKVLVSGLWELFKIAMGIADDDDDCGGDHLWQWRRELKKWKCQGCGMTGDKLGKGFKGRIDLTHKDTQDIISEGLRENGLAYEGKL